MFAMSPPALGLAQLPAGYHKAKHVSPSAAPSAAARPCWRLTSLVREDEARPAADHIAVSLYKSYANCGCTFDLSLCFYVNGGEPYITHHRPFDFIEKPPIRIKGAAVYPLEKNGEKPVDLAGSSRPRLSQSR
jgi:hypothetical protein